MTDLTEQFNNDEIDESKLYYFKQKMSEEIEVGRPFALNMVRAMDDTYLDWFLIDKVLAPVPSYEEWQRILHYAGKYEFEYTSCVMDYENLKEENTKLKELLKEVLRHELSLKEISELTRKICQALGEDK